MTIGKVGGGGLRPFPSFDTGSVGRANSGTNISQSIPQAGDGWVPQSPNTSYQRLLGGDGNPASYSLVNQPLSGTRDPRLPPGAVTPPPLGDFSALENVNMATATPEQILRVQDALITLGYLSPSVRDNSGYGNTFGPASQQALHQFQMDHGQSPSNTISAKTAQYLGTPLTTGPFLPDGPKNVVMPDAAYQPPTGTWPPSPTTPDYAALQNPALADTLANFDRNNPEQVRAVQERLLELGFFPPDKANDPGFGNTFGPTTQQALMAFEAANNISPANGRMTPDTIARLAQPLQVGPNFGVQPGTVPGHYGRLGPPNALCEGALATSAAQMNPETATLTYNGVSLQQDPTVWNNRCLGFVARCYDPRVPLLSAGNAITAYQNFQNAGLIVNSTSNIPAGVPMFFGPSEANGQDGHVVIFTGRYTDSGEPIVRSSGWDSRPGIFEVPLSEMARLTGAPYLGWGNITGQPPPSQPVTVNPMQYLY